MGAGPSGDTVTVNGGHRLDTSTTTDPPHREPPGTPAEGTPGPLATRARTLPAGAKLASVVANRIVSDIAAAGWPEGEVIGSEAQLLERYGVSRAVFREAVRLLEHQQVGRMRRGPGGGLVVTEPSVESVMDAVSVYLLFIRAELDDVIEARLALEVSAAQLASERLTEDGLDRLREHAAREVEGQGHSHRDLHNLVAASTANPALAFLVELLHQVTLLYAPESSVLTASVLRASADAHQKIVESVVAGDPGQAGNRMRRHLEAEADLIRRNLPRTPRLDDVFAVPTGGTKLAESIARQIFAEVTASDWQVGQALGSEPELMERFDVSRAVLREAVRVLEHHEIARMRRGPGGGLFVAEPGVEATTEAVALYLSRRAIEPTHLFEVRGIVEMAVLDRVVERLDDAMVATLEEVLEVERGASAEDFPVLGHDLHQVLADLSGNRVLALLTDVLITLSRGLSITSDEPVDEALATDEVIHTHRRIVEAILARDVELARHRMRRHLDAIIHWVR